jgi:hypothetical protein
MRFINHIMVFCIVIFHLVSCESKDNTIIKARKEIKKENVTNVEILSSEQTKNLWFIKFQKPNMNFKWMFKQDSLVSLKYLESWQPIQTDDYLFFAELDSLNKYSFVVTLMYKKKNIGIKNLDSYLKEVNRQLRIDTNEILIWSNFYTIYNYDKKSEIYGEIASEIDSISYVILTCYAEDDSNIYDFSMKLPLDSINESHYQVFYEYINSFKYLNRSIVSEFNSATMVGEIRAN